MASSFFIAKTSRETCVGGAFACASWAQPHAAGTLGMGSARPSRSPTAMPDPIDHLLRSNLRGFSAYKPGTSVDEARRRYGVERVAKLSQNENPLGSSPKALAALKAVPTYSDYVEDD